MSASNLKGQVPRRSQVKRNGHCHSLVDGFDATLRIRDCPYRRQFHMNRGAGPYRETMSFGPDGKGVLHERAFSVFPPQSQVEFAYVPVLWCPDLEINTEPTLARRECLDYQPGCLEPWPGLSAFCRVLFHPCFPPCGSIKLRPKAFVEVAAHIIVNLECARR